jgi:hypothetical protein
MVYDSITKKRISSTTSKAILSALSQSVVFFEGLSFVRNFESKIYRFGAKIIKYFFKGSTIPEFNLYINFVLQTNRMKKYFFVLSILFLFCSCFHKSVEKDEADNIISSIIYHGKEGSYLVTVESIFQANSKSSNNGISTTTGYVDLRITSYDLASGKQTGRVATGGQIDENIILLGWSEGNIWFYSLKDGLHSRNPKTMEIKTTQDKIFENNKALESSLATGEWYKLSDYFSFDYTTGKLIITDKQGYRYSLDPVSFKTEKISDNYKMPDNTADDYLSTSAYNAGKYIYLPGELRKQIQIGDSIPNEELTYLDGKLIRDMNFLRLYKRTEYLYKRTEETSKAFAACKDSLKARYGESSWKYPDDIQQKYHYISQNESKYQSLAETYEREFNDISVDHRVSSLSYVLSPDTNTFFVAYRSTTANDARLMIACLEIKNNKLSEKWKTELSEVFYDYSKAEETDAFKKVFSKGDPEFDYMYFDFYENKFIIIYMLHAYCLDIKMGNTIWKFKF